MINILFSARAAQWPVYRAPLEAAFAAKGLKVNLTDRTDAPETVDYLVYAPAREDDDLSVYTNLKLIQSLWAGPDKLLKNKTLTQPMARMVDPGMTQGMVDYVFGHIMRHHLEVDRFSNAKPGAWLTDWAPPLPADRTVAILGIGALGMACAKVAHGYGFNVIGWSRTQKEGAPFPCYAGVEGLEQTLAQADIIVTLLPNTPATEGLINKETIAQMKDGAAIINPGRGQLIDDDALLAALNSSKISGATLDVFHTEPLPAEHPYWHHPNVLVTPHVASETRATTAADIVAENIARVEEGKEALYLIDPTLKY
ncbi:2-hydroxyacid dehydrogenase [Neptunicoccus cionae]|uniref:Glyoxylate/hydroxypyruvate reductase A n=1 Tax=Neptunicoccus cionae TaxID=2035344 RepID=A0A916QZR9_9RHOB|nr:glyoxylate/hydroxypyruvate reductase A [Amylibacter cionae]GGA22455.1 glyoxylate/hydroxypyruvate reductase A [Amylibacter cionae]